MDRQHRLTLIDSLLLDGLDDYIDPAWIHSEVRGRGITQLELEFATGAGVVAELVLDGLCIAGTLVGGSFAPWLLSSEEAVARVIQDWLTIIRGGRRPTPFEVVLLELTDAGRDRAGMAAAVADE